MGTAQPRHVFVAAESQSYGDAQSEPVSLEYLRRYTLGNVEVEREVLQLFCAHAPTVLADLKSAASEKAWRDAAHTLKGSALSLGAWHVARLAEQAEATSFDSRERIALLATLESALEEACDFIAAATQQA